MASGEQFGKIVVEMPGTSSPTGQSGS